MSGVRTAMPASRSRAARTSLRETAPSVRILEVNQTVRRRGASEIAGHQLKIRCDLRFWRASLRAHSPSDAELRAMAPANTLCHALSGATRAGFPRGFLREDCFDLYSRSQLINPRCRRGRIRPGRVPQTRLQERCAYQHRHLGDGVAVRAIRVAVPERRASWLCR